MAVPLAVLLGLTLVIGGLALVTGIGPKPEYHVIESGVAASGPGPVPEFEQAP